MRGMASEPRIGTTIRRARERKRWTQKQLAGALGVSVRTVNDWENDRAYPRSSIGALEDVLGISLDDRQAEPLVSPELRHMIAKLTPEERDWVLGELRKVSGQPLGPAPGESRREAG